MKALDGPIPSIGIIVIETTERKRAEDALRESDERPREAQRVGQIGSLEGDIHTDELWWPDGLFHLFGLERAEFFPTKDSFTELLHPDECGGHHDIRTG
jgi:PAS domain-containing protein